MASMSTDTPCEWDISAAMTSSIPHSLKFDLGYEILADINFLPALPEALISGFPYQA
jgi:hypothetical protein